eukprot:CAMPEP_0182416566 /NCGR_PEP_ID=MMETSP1167-20130531/913_1 /TAXON_ID=2988 /ORGANISM="Mallomonas Sp, Strain CCMP3275" /LENGTH=325 /DNA_ID=CAMNT_0024589465 /DNA_START=35 /DNA_END=1012 /DNA_ORIENTATION=-
MFKSNNSIIAQDDNGNEDSAVVERVRLVGPRVALKFLVSNNLAGAVIGKAGQNVSSLQEETGARVKVSLATDLYPGTQERVILVTGAESTVIHASSLIVDRALEVEPARNDGSITIKILVPAPACGLLIGKGGAHIKSLSEESGARVRLSPKSESVYTAERVMIITGVGEDCSKCISLVIGKLLEDATVGTYQNMTTSYSRFNAEVSLAAAAGALAGGSGGPDGVTATTTIHMEVPDDMVGNLLGKRGATIAEIQSLSGAKVTVTPRGEYVAGTTNRIVSITGSFQSAQMAQFFLNNKLKSQAGRASASAEKREKEREREREEDA